MNKNKNDLMKSLLIIKEFPLKHREDLDYIYDKFTEDYFPLHEFFKIYKHRAKCSTLKEVYLKIPNQQKHKNEFGHYGANYIYTWLVGNSNTFGLWYVLKEEKRLSHLALFSEVFSRDKNEETNRKLPDEMIKEIKNIVSYHDLPILIFCSQLLTVKKTKIEKYFKIKNEEERRNYLYRKISNPMLKPPRRQLKFETMTAFISYLNGNRCDVPSFSKEDVALSLKHSRFLLFSAVDLFVPREIRRYKNSDATHMLMILIELFIKKQNVLDFLGEQLKTSEHFSPYFCLLASAVKGFMPDNIEFNKLFNQIINPQMYCFTQLCNYFNNTNRKCLPPNEVSNIYNNICSCFNFKSDPEQFRMSIDLYRKCLMERNCLNVKTTIEERGFLFLVSLFSQHVNRSTFYHFLCSILFFVLKSIDREKFNDFLSLLWKQIEWEKTSEPFKAFKFNQILKESKAEIIKLLGAINKDPVTLVDLKKIMISSFENKINSCIGEEGHGELIKNIAELFVGNMVNVPVDILCDFWRSKKEALLIPLINIIDDPAFEKEWSDLAKVIPLNTLDKEYYKKKHDEIHEKKPRRLAKCA
ncbi:MAG: hypothetical protein HQK52_12115 [Oligoflexia bacterium]|nr:hypothetical protein [Oligoflexia bacterium]